MVEWDDGSWEDWNFTVESFTTDRSAIQHQFPDERRASQRGTIVGGSLAAIPGTLKRGQFYGQLGLWRNNVYFDPLASGYIYPDGSPALGEFHEPGPGGGHGAFRSIALGNPAAGAEYADQTVPTGAIWKVLGFRGVLVTDANAADRVPQLVYTDGTTALGGGIGTRSQVASGTMTWTAGIGLPASGGRPTSGATGLVEMIALPDLSLPEAYVIDFTTAGLQATDDWGAGRLFVEEWVVP